MFNFQTGVYEEVNSADENFPLDGTSSIEIGASKYVDANNCVMKTRLSWEADGFTINFPWEIRLDHVSIQVAE